MRAEGRFEAAGWWLSREIIAAVCEDDDLIPASTSLGFVMLAVTFSWGLASPVIYGGRLLDRACAFVHERQLSVQSRSMLLAGLASVVSEPAVYLGTFDDDGLDEEPQGFVIDR